MPLNRSWHTAKNKPEIAAVSDEGFVTAKKAGSAVITVKTTDGSKKKVKLKVTVRPGKPVNFIVQKKGKKKAVFSWDPVAGARDMRLPRQILRKENIPPSGREKENQRGTENIER